MRSLKGPFGRLRLPLTENVMCRARMLRISAQLLNLRAHRAGLNQIRIVYFQLLSDPNPRISRFIAEEDAMEECSLVK